MSFAVDVNKWIETKAISNRNPKKVRDGVTFKLLAAVVKDNPVDTGRARGNWQTNAKTPKTGQLGIRSVVAVFNEAARELRPAPMEDTIYLSNNLPYAGVLEFGGYPGIGPSQPPKTVQGNGGIFSSQAPAGMVRKNVTRFQDLIDREARKVNK